jgi:hypothetical protein
LTCGRAKSVTSRCSYQTWWIIPITPFNRARARFYTHPLPLRIPKLPIRPAVAQSAARQRASAPNFPSPQPVPSGAGASGTLKRYCTLQRRLVSPAAMAGVRCLLALGPRFATPIDRPRQCDTQPFVSADEVILGPPPLQIDQQIWQVLQG